jgi:hypothetical protein
MSHWKAMRGSLLVLPLLTVITGTVTCHRNSSGNGDGGVDGGVLPALTSTLVDTTFTVADHMRAAREMQLSGEPFAQLLGYNLNYFSRTLIIPDQYLDPATQAWVTDPLGYALAIETYEYSKQPMNNLSFESGAGLSLQFGPVLNPTQEAGDGGYALLVDRFQQFATESNSGGPAGTALITSPAPVANYLNFYGWPGLWPQFAEFSSFNPSIEPSIGAVLCSFGSGEGAFSYGTAQTDGGLVVSQLIADYECDYNSLNLPDREHQVTKTIQPGALGYVVWKQGLWVINYWGTLHDTKGNGITNVAMADLPNVGQPGNTVVGQYPDPTDPTGMRMLDGAPGTYLGDIPMEGWQGLTMMEEIDNKAAFVLGSLTSSDGTHLQGVPSILAAINYSYDSSSLLYFPASIAVVETPTTSDPLLAKQYFPQPTSLSIADGTSQLRDLSGLIGGFGEAFAFTDRNNANVGGSDPFLATFDGDPFPWDNGMPDGQPTLHDRTLGILKIAMVDLDRLHFDPTNQVLVDSATITGGTTTRGTTVTTVELVESILALRNAYRALNSSLQLYSNDTPDNLEVPSALDNAPLTGASYSGTLASHLIALIGDEANFLSAKLIDANGAVSNSYDLSAKAPSADPTVLEAETGAIRGLLDAYLATNNESYRQRATQVYADLQNRFWMTDILCFRTTAGVDSPMKFTPIRFGLLSGALRQYYKLVASVPGNVSGCGQSCASGEPCTASRIVECPLLQEMKRIHKLILNGWNDRNQDDRIQYPDECTGAGLEMAERALTAELGRPGDLGDREMDCIREISYQRLPAALGAELDISR